MLEDGRIPPHTVCPYKDKCEVAAAKRCHHEGTEHQVAFSCAIARAYELIEEIARR